MPKKPSKVKKPGARSPAKAHQLDARSPAKKKKNGGQQPPDQVQPLLEPKNYRPTLNPIEVPLDKLLLDPNNPRILTDSSSPIPEDRYADPGVQDEAIRRMEDGDFNLATLKQSILRNSWQPVDMMFVKRLSGGQFVVLEGNRRLTALRSLAHEKPPGFNAALKDAIDPLPALEVVGTDDIEESRAQITYLLGVRHHGSLKTWAPFARAHNMYERYLHVGGMTNANFVWKESVALRVAETLSVSEAAVEEALRVYRVMQQLNEHPPIKAVGIEGRFYSLTREALSRPSKSPLRARLACDPQSFRLDQASLKWMDTVCHFSTQGRKDAPVSSPVEWRSLEKILADDDPSRMKDMLREVEVEKKKPSDVYANRAAELRKPRWDRWLKQVAELLNKLSVGNLETTEEAIDVAKALAGVLDLLDSETRAPS